jgi:4-diphosphocytidyl-2-C-methyl-D-erythritol kinase
MTTTIKIEAPAKVNLTFELRGLLPDNYHEVKTLLQTVSLCDWLTFNINRAREPEVNIAVSTKAADFPLGADNLIARAIRLYLSHVGLLPPLKVDVFVEKRIPIGAGLAGGSSNAAAALLAINSFNQNKVPEDELSVLAAKLGADVPFSLKGGTSIGTVRGDVLDLVPQAKELHLVLAKHQHLSIATPWVYKSYDELQSPFGLSERLRDRGIADDATDFAAEKLQEDPLAALKAFGNDFEQVVFPHYQELKELKQTLLEAGARACHMTGSGPTMFAVAEDAKAASAIAAKYKELTACKDMVCATKFDPVDLFVCSSVPYGARIIEQN